MSKKINKKILPLVAIFFIISLVITTEYSLTYFKTEGQASLPEEYNWQDDPAARHTYIVFIKGLCTYCDGTRYNNMDFTRIREKLARAGFQYRDKRFLQFSYQGGRVAGGKWHPDKYSREDTGQPVEISVKHLQDMLEDFTGAHPGARFILVGHSMGGVVAYNYLSKYIENGGNSRVEAVITINSPLAGTIYSIPGPLLDILKNRGSVWGSVAVKQLAVQKKYQDIMKKWRIAVARAAGKEGIHVATFATRQDLIVLPSSACLMDGRNRPVADGDIISVNPFQSFPASLYAHELILQRDAVADYILHVLDEEYKR